MRQHSPLRLVHAAAPPFSAAPVYTMNKARRIHQRRVSPSSPPLRPSRTRMNLAATAKMLVVMTMMIAMLLSSSMADAAAVCGNASTLLLDSLNKNQGIAYRIECVARRYHTRLESDKSLSLNVSNLQLTRVVDFPVVTTLLLYNNDLTTFRSPGGDGDGAMAELDLHANAISDLDAVVLPPRLTKLNLASNRINLVSSRAPWPASLDLKWLALDQNPLLRIDATAFTPLTSLHYLSLSATTLKELGGLAFPPSLHVLNLSRNALSSESLNFSTPLLALHTLDLSANRLTAFPDLSAMSALADLNLASNQLTAIHGVRLPPKLTTLNLTGNAVESIEIARSDLLLLDKATVILPPSTSSPLLTSCKNPSALLTSLASKLVVCVLSDDAFAAAYITSASTSATPTPPPSPATSPISPSTLNDDTSSSSSSSSSSSASARMSSKAMLLLGLGCFGMGILVAAFVFIVRRDKTSGPHNTQFATFAPELSNGSSRPYDGLSGRGGADIDDEFSSSNVSWIFESPVKMHASATATGGGGGRGGGGHGNVVAILEDDRQRRGRGRSKVEDLLVYEIPLDEIVIQEPLAVPQRSTQRSTVMYKADYQGYQVVMHALLHRRRSHSLHRGGRHQRRRMEREFVEQVRLASTLEHLCIVQFIGVTFGATSHSQHKWKMGVVFEFMHSGSLAALFHEERTRREGKQYCRTTPLAASSSSASASSSSSSSASSSSSSFSWYPGPVAPPSRASPSPSPPLHTPQRCKLSIALDVAMALGYLHSMGFFHGDLKADKVLLNQQGEAKLSGMDVNLHINVPATSTSSSPPHLLPDVRASAIRAKIKVLQVLHPQQLSHQHTHNQQQSTSISQSPATAAAMGSSLLNSRAATHRGVAVAVGSSLSTSALLTSSSFRARTRGMHDDVYAFGLLLWELDTMMCVDAMKRLTAVAATTAATEPGEVHRMLRFSRECPSEIQFLARRCWHREPRQRPSAVELQEELVRMLEGRLTRLSERSRSGNSSANRWSRRTSMGSSSSSISMSSQHHQQHQRHHQHQHHQRLDASTGNASFASSSGGFSLGSSRSQSLSDFGATSVVVSNETEV